jgi:hypothetical protein
VPVLLQGRRYGRFAGALFANKRYCLPADHHGACVEYNSVTALVQKHGERCAKDEQAKYAFFDSWSRIHNDLTTVTNSKGANIMPDETNLVGCSVNLAMRTIHRIRQAKDGAGAD